MVHTDNARKAGKIMENRVPMPTPREESGNSPASFRSPVFSFIVLAGALALSEFLVMFLLPLLSVTRPWLNNLIDAVMMILLSAPALHFLVLRPLRQHIAERRKAQEELQRHRHHLEELVAERTGQLEGKNRELEREIQERRAAESALQQSEQFNRSIIESSRDCIKVLDLEGRLRFMSQGGQDLLKIRDLTPFLGKSYEEFWGPTEKPPVRLAIAEALQGRIGTFTGYCPTADGIPKWWDVAVSPIFLPGGEVARLLVVSRDITARREAEQELQRAKDELEMRVEDRTKDLSEAVGRLKAEIRVREQVERRLTDTKTLLELCVTQRSRSTYLEAVVRLCQTWCECAGAGVRLMEDGNRAPFKACVGLSKGFLDIENAFCIHSERCSCMQRLGERQSTDRLSVGTSGSFIRNQISDLPEDLHSLRAGELPRPCIQAGYESIAFVPLWHGKELLGSIYLADPAMGKFRAETVELIESVAPLIGEALLRFHAEDRLHESEQRFRSLFERHHSVMLLIDPENGAVIDANPAAAKFYGKSRDELRAMNVENLGISLRLLRSMDGGTRSEESHGTVQVTGRFGSETRTLEIYSSPVTIRGRSVLFPIIHDVTDRQRMERQILEISETEQQRLGRDLHDGLGQHLTATAFMAKALAMKLTTVSSPEAASAECIVECVNQAIVTTRQIALGLCPVDVARNGLKPVLHQYAATTRQLFGVECVFAPEAEFPLFEESAALHCYRIVQEAVTNAVRHGKPHRVEIRLANEKDGLALTVRDDGSGFPPRRDTTRGMGLHTMRFRADALGARLSVEPATTGGTLVTCFFPRTASEEHHTI